MKRATGILLISVFLAISGAAAQQAESPEIPPVESQEELAGELFGVSVPMNNYYFAKANVLLFGNRWGASPRNEQEVEQAAWDQLLMSFIAFREQLDVPREDVEQEITRTLQAEGAGFDWKSDRQAYEAWVKEKTRLSVEVFEGQLRHLLQISRLRDKVRESINPEVTEEEARQKFLNENNTLSVELAQFDDLTEAERFYRKSARSSRYWEKYKKRHPGIFKRPGFVSLEFQIDLWGFPQQAADEMMAMQPGEVYPPRAIYKGYAVFKVLETRPADRSLFAGAKEGYIEKVRDIKKHQGLDAWMKNLRQRADIKVYRKS